MHQVRGKRQRSTGRLSLLGDGLFERARSTSFALLGLATAACLGIVALAVNQDWPTIVESPIPALPGPPAGDDRDAAQRGVVRAGRPSVAAALAERAARAAAVASEPVHAATPTSAGDEPTGQVVSTSVPVGGGDGADSDGRDARPAPGPSPAPVSPPSPRPVPAPDPPGASPPAPPAPTAPPAPEPPPPAAASGPPGNGNAYGWEKGKAKGHDR